jgi:hypothetical protein
MGIHVFQNQGIPLGYDHGAYRHFVNILEKTQDIEKIPLYLQYQFEPFSGTFFYILLTYLGPENVFSWGYYWLYIMIWMSFLLLWKRSHKYTLWSYVAFFLFIFSVLQYTNFWWSFGKQLFATLFLILFIRYYSLKKTFIYTILFTACIALHRITGFIAIMYVLSWYFLQKNKINKILLLGLWLGIVSYIQTIEIQIMPLLKSIFIEKYIFVHGKYGTGFDRWIFFIYILPVLILSFSTIYKKSIKNLYQILFICWFLWVIVITQSIAYSRIQTFVEIFLIILISQIPYRSINKKILIVVIIIHMSFWFAVVQKWHTPDISYAEHEILKDFIKNTPEDATIVTLDAGYMSMMMGLTSKEIYNPDYWIWTEIFIQSDSKKIRTQPQIFCKNLFFLWKKIFVYKWINDISPSLYHNACLQEIKSWGDAKLFLYNENKE